MVDRFLGSGFWVDNQGHFLTCGHVLQELKSGQCPAIGQPFGEAKDRYIRVVEFTHMVMGPSCGLVLADLGAEVIKVEPIGHGREGDATRRLIGSGSGFFPLH